MIHKFEDAGLGKAPFRLIGVYSFPSATLAEHNPTAYNNALALMPRDVACGSCAFCGMSLVHNFIIQSADQRKFVVGCDCVEKTGDAGLVSAIKLQKRRERQAQRMQAQAADAKARLAAERAENGGLTLAEIRAKKEAELAALRAPLEQAIVESLSPIIRVLDANPGDFTRMVSQQLMACNLKFSPRIVSIMLEIVAKQAGRRNSKAYHAKWDEMNALWQRAVADFSALPV